MFCKKCGRVVSIFHWRYCPYCGKGLPTVEEVVEKTRAEEVAQKAEEEAQRKRAREMPYLQYPGGVADTKRKREGEK